jgi:hypothetical protein
VGRAALASLQRFRERAPLFDDDSALLLVDEALAAAGVLGGATREVVRQAIEELEVRGILQRDVARGLVAIAPPPAQS